jgi:hypothetical protein
MRVIQPVPLTDANLFSTSVPEADHPVWSSATAYTVGQRVIMQAGVHAIFECLVNNTNVNPNTDITGKWLRVSATNRWKAFDQIIGDRTSLTGLIEYTIVSPGACQAIAVFNISATTLAVRVTDASSAIVHDQTYDLVETVDVSDWFGYFYEPNTYKPELIINNLPIFAGYKVRIQLNSTGTTSVGEIVFGYDRFLGDTLVQPRIGIEDFSVKNVDDFGFATLIPRTYSDRGEFAVAITDGRTQQVKRYLTSLRATPAVYYLEADTERLGTTIFGYYTDFSIVLESIDYAVMTVTLEGLI